VDSTIGIETWGGGSRKYKGKLSKLEIIRAISRKRHVKVLDISAMNLKDLNFILKELDSFKAPDIPVITGRSKAPYIAELIKVFPTVESFNKLSVESLKQLIGALKC
jgi:hypothetical protein